MSARALGAFVLAGAVGVASAGPAQEAPCANFGQVSPGLYRGAEPDDRCLDHLAGLGIRMVVNLRDEKDASDREAHEGWAADRAVEEAKRFGLAWWQVRMKRFIQEFGAAGG